ncbi:MAG: cobalamin biosynthesis protein CobQ [Dinoroseobacter sp.]|nr:cobalamin biosynthesis protein CobQ [Dinoroseobacter sp.]
MNTPAHLIFGAAVFARPDAPRVTAAALAGALFPDLSLYVLGAWALFVQQIPPQIVFDELYFSAAWQQVFAIDNSIPLWTLVMAFAAWAKRPVVFAFAGAALLHLLLDLPLHHDDGRPHFWPFTMWVYESPLSYWDSARYARFVAPVEAVACLVLVVILWRRFKSWTARIGFGVLMAMELWVIRQWLLFF